MARPLSTFLAGAVTACVISAIPVAGAAQMRDVAPSGSFSFDAFFGSAQPQTLPLEMSGDSDSVGTPFPTEIAEVMVQPAIPDVQTTRVRSRLIRNTWSVGVFR
ncbi:hypothetical protein [Yoonia sp. 2307UL14-13]|uniref:hypothetical protein n=1 Tax=Yoonia sp. 2307UL14-13 TaxID=3126506 RepID=UPI0030A70F16